MFLRKRLRDAGRRGSLSLEVIAAVAFLGMVVTFAGDREKEMRETSHAASLANQLNMAAKGAQNFLDANTALITTALAGDASGAGARDYIVVNQDNVTDQEGNPLSLSGHADNGLRDYMPVTFRQTRYGQNVRMHVYKGGDGAVHALLSTNGGWPEKKSGGFQSEEDKRLYLSAARKASSMNGFGIMTTNSVSGNNVNAIVGPHDAWRFETGDPDYGNIPDGTFAEGQLARPLYAYSAAVKDDMLYRSEIEGHPELNAMQTDFHMNGYQITDTGTITISQHPRIAGADGEFAQVPPGGNGLVIEPYETDGEIHVAASQVCSGVGGPENAKPDGFHFTMKQTVQGLDGSTGDGGDPGVLGDDLNGLWMCLNGEARLISDSANSSTIKGSILVRSGDTVRKPRCPNGTTPAIYVTPAALAPVAGAADSPYPITAFQAKAENSGNDWVVKVLIKSLAHKGTGIANTIDRNAGWFEPTGNSAQGGLFNYAIAQVMCERNNDSWEKTEGTY